MIVDFLRICKSFRWCEIEDAKPQIKSRNSPPFQEAKGERGRPPGLKSAPPAKELREPENHKVILVVY